MILKHLSKKSEIGLNYLLYLPDGYSEHTPGEFPIIFFLHGAGERGNNLELLTTQGLPAIIESQSSFPFIVVSPQCPSGTYWSVTILKSFIDEVLHDLKPDLNRVYITGISMGGYGTWTLAINYPEIFAAAIPICGGGDPESAHKIKSLPVWAFHGAKDNIVPPWETENMVKALQEAGGNVKLTIYPDEAHDSWTKTYANPEVYEWLLSHEKKN
ncbi:prolyl oligopeptidase family serine peptidase [Cytophagaceae bacterium ABcell3]|nr:prolyl oligopeptidase family serine peptidase [Cytophagaceae bacterium ABcell3]